MLKTIMVVLLMFTSFCVNAGIVSFSGQLENDRYAHALFTFSVGQNSSVDIWTDSALDHQNTHVNFDPMLSLYDSTGKLVGWGDDYDPYGDYQNSGSWHDGMKNLDTSLSFQNLNSGNYTIAISSYMSGYYSDFVAGKTLQQSLVDPISSGSHDIHKMNNTGLVFNINQNITANPSNVPEPGMFVLLLTALLGFAFAKANTKQYVRRVSVY